MITPGFFGYFNTQRGLLTAQTGINTVNHNISNANTPGYTRQRVDQKTMFPFESPRPNGSLASLQQMGQGVFVQAITRVTDGFLDGQIRTENARNEFLTLKENVLSQIESVLGEPSDTGLQASMQTFFNAAQDLSLHPESMASRTVYIRAAEDMVNVFQDKAQQLQDLRTTYVGEPGNATSVANSQLNRTTGEANQLLQQVADLNMQIVMVTGTGGQPNDLLDARDQALKSLNAIMDITVSISNSQQANISVNTPGGPVALVQGNRLNDTLRVVANPGPSPTPADVPALVQLTTNGSSLNTQITTGKLGALLQAGGNTAGSVSIQQVLQQVNTLFNTVAGQINTLQTTGRDLNGNLATTEPIFNLATGTSLPVFRYSINTNLITNPRLIAAANNDSTTATGFAGVSDGRNATAIAQIKQQTFAALGNAQPLEYWNQTVATTGSAVNQAKKQGDFQQNVLDSLEGQRSEFAGVNIDEEMIDLLKYQRAFEASAKTFKAYDDIMQSILNIMPG
jgi:flagellar hook-associated protein 1